MLERDGALFVRLFNAGGKETVQELGFSFDPREVELIELDSRLIEELKPNLREGGTRTFRLGIPRFGIRTLRFSGMRSPRMQGSGL